MDQNYKENKELEKAHSSSDINNNKPLNKVTTESSNESIPERKHTKFCFSRDISEKEESLRNCRASCSTHNLFDRFSCRERKSVTFRNHFPVYLDISKKKWKEDILGSDSENESNQKRYSDASSETNFLDLSNDYMFEFDADSEKKYDIISKAQNKLTNVWYQLENILFNTQDPECVTDIPLPKNEKRNLLDVVRLIETVVDKLDNNYRNTMNGPKNIDKLAELASSNQFLRDQLKYTKTMKDCLESEIKYVTKEKSMLNEELNQLTYRIAMMGFTKETFTKDCLKVEVKAQNTEVFYRNPHQRFQQSDSNSSAIASSSDKVIEKSSTDDKSNQTQNGLITLKIEKAAEENGVLVEKWDNYFNPIMECVEVRGTEMENLQMRLKNYEEDLHNLQLTITSMDREKFTILADLENLVEQQKTLLREKDRYESILKIILKEKENSCGKDFVFNLQDLLQKLLEKVINIPLNSTNGIPSESDNFLEGALQAVQEQNSGLRIEISRLKDKLSAAKALTDSKISEVVAVNFEAFEQVDQLSMALQEQDKNLQSTSMEAEIRFNILQDLHKAVTQAKEALEKSIVDKENEVQNLKEKLESIQKSNMKQQKKVHDLYKTNSKLVKEVEELQQNMKHLSSIITQLKSNFKTQKSQWSERIRLATEETSQSKEHSKWLQSQIDHMNQQLDDAHERIKAHETDKAQLAQQVILADEERRIVERKLNELRSALQGDSFLREALIERNEALQIEIHRLQKSARPGNFGVSENPPPMEMNNIETTDTFFSIKSFPPTEYSFVGEKSCIKKNRFLTSSSRRGPDIPRTAVSLHNGGTMHIQND